MVLRHLKVLGRLALALLALSLSTVAVADSWVPPERTTYFSANRAYRLIVTPHIPADRDLWPFTGRPRGPSAPDKAHGMLQHRDANGRWRAQWRGPLRNPVMPVEAMVADSGRYFVTFDDWGGTGHGPNVVVIYHGTGRTIRALSILDLLPEYYVRTLQSSFSSVRWGGRHSFSADGEKLRLALALPGESIFPSSYFTHSVTLETGEPFARAGAEWDRAMAASVAWRVAEQDRQAAYFAFMTEPLTAPKSSDRAAWDEYLTEAFKRLAPDGEMNNPWNMLVRQPGAPPYDGAFSPDPKTIFEQRNLPSAIAIASPEGAALAPALQPLLERRRPGWLRRVRLYIVADDAAWPDLIRLFLPSGATMIQIDPVEPIPQRPERLPGIITATGKM